MIFKHLSVLCLAPAVLLKCQTDFVLENSIIPSRMCLNINNYKKIVAITRANHINIEITAFMGKNWETWQLKKQVFLTELAKISANNFKCLPQRKTVNPERSWLFDVFFFFCVSFWQPIIKVSWHLTFPVHNVSNYVCQRQTTHISRTEFSDVIAMERNFWRSEKNEN